VIRVTRLRYAPLVYTPILPRTLETRGRGLRLIRWCSVLTHCDLGVQAALGAGALICF